VTGPWPDGELPPVACHTWRITTKPVSHQLKGSVSNVEVYELNAARAEVSNGHVVFFDADGMLKHVRATGTFETVTRVEHVPD